VTGWQVRRHFWELAYLQFKFSLGLLCHPFSTMQELHFHSWQRLFVFTPVFYFVVATVLWRLLLRPVIILLLPVTCPLMIIKTTALFFCFFWQITLFYLIYKFELYQSHHRKVT